MANHEEKKWYGYVGKILRINLTDSTTEVISSEKYLPEYIGGKMLCTKIFWDEVGPGVGAFDPENKLILAPGATTGTGIPTGGRTAMGGIAPNSLPEQFSVGNIGGQIGTVLKYAGYDALIIEGKAPKHTYVVIDDDEVSFLDAELIWGMTVHNTQRSISLAHGPDFFSMVIGPAGENLVRIASITTSNDHALAKTGFGAVFGSKNLKAIAFRGTGEVAPGDIDKVMELRKRVGEARQVPNRVQHQTTIGLGQNAVPADWDLCRFTCSPGCTARCQRTMMGVESAFTGERVDQIDKCVSARIFGIKYDSNFPAWGFIATDKNDVNLGQTFSWGQVPDVANDPDAPRIAKEVVPGDKVNFFGTSFDRGNVVNQMCNEYGLDKWDIDIWYFGWLAMAGKEHLLDDLDFGMKPDTDDIVFIKHFLTSITYRIGIGDIFAEGMARAIRTLGKEKYGDTTFKGRTSAAGRQLDLPVSIEVGWGQSAHWTGRGTQGAPKWLWSINSFLFMTNTRDPISSGHIKVRPEDLDEFYKDGPLRSQRLIDLTIRNEYDSILKDSLTTCEWQSPKANWPEQEPMMLSAAIGREVTKEELYASAEKQRLLFRAVLMRNYKRCRDLEVPQVYPNMTYPDPRGETATWDEWNDAVDMYYKTSGWDLETGWPYRSTWEKAGLKDVADEMGALGLLPPEGRTEYVRKPNPIGR